MSSNELLETLDAEEATDGGMTKRRSRNALAGQGNVSVGDL
jgi:hypothetical protein